MRVKFLCLLVLLTLAALPVWSADPAAAVSQASTPRVALADILTPVPVQPAALLDLDLISSHRPIERVSCSPSCTTVAQCRDFCGCTAASCTNVFGCFNKVCDCTPCP